MKQQTTTLTHNDTMDSSDSGISLAVDKGYQKPSYNLKYILVGDT